MPTDLRAFAEARIERIPFDTCWHWVGSLNRAGYGTILAWGGKMQMAHRVVWELYRGPIPEGLTIDHLCRVHGCVNPDHLEPVTSRVNSLRGFSPAAMRARQVVCTQGHPFTPENTYMMKSGGRRCRQCGRRWQRNYEISEGMRNELPPQFNPRGDGHRWGELHPQAKLTADQVWQIRASSLAIEALADRYGVGRTTIRNIRSGRTWRHLDSSPDARSGGQE